MKKTSLIILAVFMISCINASTGANSTRQLNTAASNINNNTPTIINPKKDHSKPHSASSATYIDIPEWYLQNRVQIHTRLPLSFINSDTFFGFPKQLASYGATVLTRQIKMGDEEPWWPTQTGTLNPAAAPFNKNGKNLAINIIQQLHDLNMHAIIYYRHMEDSEMYALHPDWADKTINNLPIKNKRGTFLCFNSPYRDVVIERIKELAKFDADGFYFDDIHIPRNGCFCEYCRAKYKKEYGTDLVADYRAGNKLQYFAFRNETINSFFTDIKSSLADIGKAPVLLISGNDWPTFTNLHMNSEFYKHFILKSESDIPLKTTTLQQGIFKMPLNYEGKISPFNLNAFGFSYMRDNSAGPPHIWCAKIRSANEAIATASALISLGCIANLDIDAQQSDIKNFEVPMSWNKKYGEYFKTLTPYSYVGVYLSEKQRNQYIQSPDQAWANVIMPAYTSFEKLYQAGIPTQIIADASFNDNDVSALEKIYCSTSLTGSAGGALGSKLSDNSTIASLNGKGLAKSVNAPIFCLKDNDQVNVNYFKDKSGHLYIITGADFSRYVHLKNDNAKANNVRPAGNGKLNGNLHLYIKKSAIAGNIEDLVNTGQIKSSGSDGDYMVFTLKADYNSLGMFRFSSNL